MKSLDEQLAEYGAHHTKKGTIISHLIGIPAVILGLLILFTWLRIDIFNAYTIAFSWLIVLATLAYYFTLDKKMCGIMAIIFIPLTLITTWWTGATPTTASIIAFIVLFVGGWIVQFIGHSIEKKRPAFMKSAMQLLIAPIFIVIEISIMCGMPLRDIATKPAKKTTKKAAKAED